MRQKAGLSQRDLARRADLSITTIQRIEQGTLHPLLQTVIQLAGGLGVDPADLIEGLRPSSSLDESGD